MKNNVVHIVWKNIEHTKHTRETFRGIKTMDRATDILNSLNQKNIREAYWYDANGVEYPITLNYTK